MDKHDDNRQAEAYQTMLGRALKSVEEATDKTLHNIHDYIEAAEEKAVYLEELSREEAERIGDYLRRDLQDAARFMAQTQAELGAWMRFDLAQIQNQFLDSFKIMVDHTRLGLDNFAQQAKAQSEWHTGEVAGPGTLECSECGKQMQFHKPGRIPPCPVCHKTLFKRVWDEE